MTVFIIALLVLVLQSCNPAYAEVWVYGGIGQASSGVTEKPGLWKQDGAFPYEFDGKDLGWRSGLGAGFDVGRTVAFDSLIEHGVFLELGAVSLGSPSIHSFFVTDAHYDPASQRCTEACGKQYQRDLQLQDDYLGAEAVVGYQATVFEFFRPYIKGGMAGFTHNHSGTLTKYGRKPVDLERIKTENFSGIMIAAVVGGGLCGDVYHGINLCGDVEKFFPVAHTANPLIESGMGGPVLTTFQVRVPLTGW